jgi:hypothetical protein
VNKERVRVIGAGETTTVLGTNFDPALRFEKALRETTQAVRREARTVFANLLGNGFGLPMQARAWTVRVESSVLPGTEVLASCSGGIPAVMHQLNLAHADACRILLAARPGLLVGELLALFAETRAGTRLGTRWAARVVMARARLALLPRAGPLGEVVEGAEQAEGDCWWADAARVAEVLGISENVLDVLRGPERGRPLAAQVRRLVAQRYRIRHVRPRVAKYEREWYHRAVAELRARPNHPYAAVMRPPEDGPPPEWGIGAGWAPWGATDWRYFRAWMLARITHAIPLVVWDAGDLPVSLPVCPCCEGKEVRLAHLIENCPGTVEARSEGSPRTLMEALAGDADVGRLRQKVRMVGRTVALVVVGLAARRRQAAGASRGPLVETESGLSQGEEENDG